MKNPFRYGGIVSDPYFADRTAELTELAREMENLNRVFLVSPRRFGKTCLLHYLKNSLEKNGAACIYIDLNAFPDLRGFAAAMTSLAAKALESNRDRLLKIFNGFQRLRPKVTVDPDGHINAGLELAVGEKEALAALVEGMNQTEVLAKKRGRHLIIIIDEFSDIEKYDGKTIEKVLRSVIQTQDHIGYIFSGSEESIMLDMIRDKKRAFYKMGRLMKLGPINRAAYIRFIMKWLGDGGFEATEEDIKRLIEIGEDVPYNIQRMCHAMWEAILDKKTVDLELIETLPGIIARQDSAHYEMAWQTATQSQKILLIALANDPQALPFSKDFQIKHGIGPSSSIKASLASLKKKGILFQTLEGRYRFVDQFMPYWIDEIRAV